MGKAQKQRANRIEKQIQNNKDEADFQEMIAAMEDSRIYTFKKGNTKLFEGHSYPGAYCKALFLKPKTEE
jgi:hypothetical protein